MHPTNSESVPLTSFDPATADAVVVVLSRAGIVAWQAEEPDDYGDVVVLVPADRRAEAMREMGQRMDEISAEVRRRPSSEPPASPGGSSDPVDDELRRGPPLIMERFADLRVLVLVVLLPLLVVTIAGPFLPRQARIVIFVLLVPALVALSMRRRR